MFLTRPIVLLTTILSSSVLLAGESSFVGSNLGAVPDNAADGRVIEFDVEGLTSNVTTVRLRLDLTHGWLGDLRAVLIAPDGFARLVVFSRIGASRTSTFGDSSGFSGRYEFSDDAVGDIWATASAAGGAETIPIGGYRTTTAGVPNRSN